MKTNYQKVTEFNAVMGLAEPDGPVGQSSTRQQELRKALIKEEGVVELEDARTLVEIMDACGDTLVVTYGLANDYKFDADIVFAIVNKANMSKTCDTPEEADDSVVAYGRGTHPDKMGEQIEAHWDEVEVEGVKYYVVYNSKTGKGLKSINFQPPEQDLETYAEYLVRVSDDYLVKNILEEHGIDAALDCMRRRLKVLDKLGK